MRNCFADGQLKRTRIARFDFTAFIRAVCNSRSTWRAAPESRIWREEFRICGTAMPRDDGNDCHDEDHLDE